MAAVVPKSASDAVLHLPDGTKKNLDIVDGIVTAAATGKASVSFRVGARLVSVPLYSDTCVQVDKNQFNKNNTIPQDVRRAMAKSGIHLCGDDAPATRP
jgi:hypothetical protein